jgi:hypothetical protein
MPSWMRFGTGVVSHGKEPAGSSRINAGAEPMTQNDPTDHALAAIAKILDKPETPPDAPDETEAKSPAETPEIQLAEEILAAPPSVPPHPVDTAAVKAEPADDADDNEPANVGSMDNEDIEPAEIRIEPTENGTYTKLGPGPLAAIRFKWTARCDGQGDYYVDETIGENSHPIINGPMTREAAIKLVDLRERQARQRFETLRSEMSGGEIGRSADE